MSFSNKLVCHFFHHNSCHKKNCKFIHSDAPLGYCPNANRCPIKHNTIDCPTYQKYKECTIPNCSYFHPEGYKKPTGNNTKLEKEEAILQNNVDDQASCAELSRHLKEINNDLKMMTPLENNIKPMMDLDVMIIMDCTGSMSPWIEAAKKELKSIIDIIVEQHAGIQIRISFVAYRDFCDKNQYEIQPFISDIDVVRKFISGLQATGGGDQAEDVAGGLTYALQQNWKSKAKYAIFIADSPAHGKDYYYYAGDEYPQGDPKGRKIETLMETFGKNDINFYAIKINDTTERMYEIMSECYQKKSGKKLQIANLGSSTKCFGFFVTCTINQTITQTSLRDNLGEINNMLLNLKQNKKSTLISYSNNMEEEKVEPQKNNFQTKELNLEIDHSICNWNKTKYTNLPAICHTWFIVKDLNVGINWRKPLIQKSQISTHVWINTKPFSAGAMRYAFFMKDLDLDQKLVAKIPKILDQNYIPEIMMKDVESIFICNHIVNEFNDRIVSIVPDPDMLISFVHSFIYEITLENFPYKYWWVENFIEGEYEKFNNNAGWEASSFKQTSLVAQCLSHFSWQFTNGFLMIVDLQGGTGVLTDPQIHCLDSKRFGKGNLGYEGILKFFFSHKCNFYCKTLGLLNPKETFELPNDFKFYKNVLEKPFKDETIHKLCDLCREPYQIGSFQYFNSRAKYPEMYCKECSFKKMSTMKEGKCIDCSNTFRSSEYWFKMKRTDFPVRCSKCRLENRNKLRKEIQKNEGKMEEEFI